MMTELVLILLIVISLLVLVAVKDTKYEVIPELAILTLTMTLLVVLAGAR